MTMLVHVKLLAITLLLFGAQTTHGRTPSKRTIEMVLMDEVATASTLAEFTDDQGVEADENTTRITTGHVPSKNWNLHALYTISDDLELAQPADGRLITAAAFKQETGVSFSKMKYGSSAALDLYSDRMAGQILETFGRAQISKHPARYVLLSPASINLPTAATLLADRIQSAILHKAGVKLEMGRMLRTGHLKVDFAKLKTTEERMAAMAGLFSYEGPSLAGKKKKLIFIEDTVVSGSHYQETQRVMQPTLERTGGPGMRALHCFVVANLEKVPPVVESELNEVYFSPQDPLIGRKMVQSLKELTDGADPTSRQVKFVLGTLPKGCPAEAPACPEARFKDFAEAFAKESDSLQMFFLAGVTRDNFHQNLKYQPALVELFAGVIKKYRPELKVLFGNLVQGR